MSLTLTTSNIESEIRRYLADTSATTIPSLNTADPIDYFRQLKRTALPDGRYPGMTILEVANRTLSDLVVLGLAERLLGEPLPRETDPIAEVCVLLGTENHAASDVIATLSSGASLFGECFNVAPSFFSSKLHKTRKKLRLLKGECVRLIAFNHDAVKDPWNHRTHSIIHLRVNVPELLTKYG